jgi:hypothetical protein
MIRRRIGFAGKVRNRYAQALTGDDGVESPALQRDGGAWVVVESGIPDGYFVQNNGKLEIDDTVSSGLPFTHDGPLNVET